MQFLNFIISETFQFLIQIVVQLVNHAPRNINENKQPFLIGTCKKKKLPRYWNSNNSGPRKNYQKRPALIFINNEIIRAIRNSGNREIIHRAAGDDGHEGEMVHTRRKCRPTRLFGTI